LFPLLQKRPSFRRRGGNSRMNSLAPRVLLNMEFKISALQVKFIERGFI
jgi:hypothetical protein